MHKYPHVAGYRPRSRWRLKCTILGVLVTAGIATILSASLTWALVGRRSAAPVELQPPANSQLSDWWQRVYDDMTVTRRSNRLRVLQAYLRTGAERVVPPLSVLCVPQFEDLFAGNIGEQKIMLKLLDPHLSPPLKASLDTATTKNPTGTDAAPPHISASLPAPSPRGMARSIDVPSLD